MFVNFELWRIYIYCTINGSCFYFMYLHWPEKIYIAFQYLKKMSALESVQKCLSLQMSTVTAKPQNYLSWIVQFVIIFLK